MLKIMPFKTFWKDSSLILKIFTGLMTYSMISNIWVWLTNPEYINTIRPFGIAGNPLLSILFHIFSLAISGIFILSVFTKGKLLFYIHLYSGVYIPFALFFAWNNTGRETSTGLFYLLFLLPMLALIFFLLYQQRSYFTK